MKLLSRSQVEKERIEEQREYQRKRKLLLDEIIRLEKQCDMQPRLDDIDKREKEAEFKMECARDIVEEYQDKLARLNDRELQCVRKEESLNLLEKHLSQVNDNISQYGKESL